MHEAQRPLLTPDECLRMPGSQTEGFNGCGVKSSEKQVNI
jgi:hypothetical protein